MKKYLFVFVMSFLLPINTLAEIPCCGPTKENAVNFLHSAESVRTYYDTFQCSCCGKPIDTNCCGMARQRKAYLDDLLMKNLDEDEIVYQMAKKFGYGVLKDPAKEQEIRDYVRSKAPANPAKIAFDATKDNLGTISQTAGIVTTTFMLKNSGGSDLIIENLDTSCGCTSVSLVYNGQEGPKFSMGSHGNNPENYQFTLPPGDSVQLKVSYDPMAHGKQTEPEQKIIRTVTIVSNDPVDFQKEVRIEFIQVP